MVYGFCVEQGIRFCYAGLLACEFVGQSRVAGEATAHC